jgi:hypothetical protein
MAKDLAYWQKRLEDEYGQIRRRFDEIHDAFDEVANAKPGDDMEGLLKKLEKQVRQVRTGGLLRPGANQYSRVLRKWKKVKEEAGKPSEGPTQTFGR